jgi:hypothetical protein
MDSISRTFLAADARPRSAADDFKVRGLVVVCGISAGAHAALIPEHWGEERLMAVGFLLAALGLAGCAWLLDRHPRSARLVAGAGALLVALIAGYAITRIAPLAELFGHAEEVDALGLTTKAFELVGLGLVLSIHKSGGLR